MRYRWFYVKKHLRPALLSRGVLYDQRIAQLRRDIYRGISHIPNQYQPRGVNIQYRLSEL